MSFDPNIYEEEYFRRKAELDKKLTRAPYSGPYPFSLELAKNRNGETWYIYRHIGTQNGQMIEVSNFIKISIQ